MEIEDTAYGVIVVHRTDTDRFLLLQQIAGHWSFPKGHKEGNESDKEAALRELAEESGIKDITLLDAPLISDSYSFTMDGTLWNKTVWYFVGFVADDTVKIQ